MWQGNRSVLVSMKKVIYWIIIPFVVILGIPFMFINREGWNTFGRKLDYYFGVKSPHTRNYERENC